MTHLMHSRPRRLASLVVATGAAVALAGCGTNIGAQTQDWYDATDGTNSSAESSLQGMAVRSVVVVSDGTDAAVVGTFVNTSDDTDGVTGISVAGESATITGDLDVEPGQSVRLGPPGEARAQVDGADLEPGSTATVEVTFEAAPKQTLNAVVRSAAGEFEQSGPQ